MIFKILFLFLLANSNAFSNNNPEYIIKKTDDQFREINNYQVDMVISIAIPAFRMPKKKYKVYFKQPDKIKVKSRGFGYCQKRECLHHLWKTLVTCQILDFQKISQEQTLMK